MQAPNTKLIRVRGPLINSSIDVNTYTVYIRPFYDEANNIGSLTLFSQPNTVYTLNGKSTSETEVSTPCRYCRREPPSRPDIRRFKQTTTR